MHWRIELRFVLSFFKQIKRQTYFYRVHRFAVNMLAVKAFYNWIKLLKYIYITNR